MSSATRTAVPLPGANRLLRQGHAVPRQISPRQPRGIVLTRRGRLLLRAGLWLAVTTGLAVGLVLLWITVAASVAPGAAAGSGGPAVTSVLSDSEPRVTVDVVVDPGDTLWQIAGEHAPERDPRAVVADIVTLNELPSAGVQAGQTLLVPVD